MPPLLMPAVLASMPPVPPRSDPPAEPPLPAVALPPEPLLPAVPLSPEPPLPAVALPPEPPLAVFEAMQRESFTTLRLGLQQR